MQFRRYFDVWWKDIEQYNSPYKRGRETEGGYLLVVIGETGFFFVATGFDWFKRHIDSVIRCTVYLHTNIIPIQCKKISWRDMGHMEGGEVKCRPYLVCMCINGGWASSVINDSIIKRSLNAKRKCHACPLGESLRDKTETGK